jgi:hypothetical protein
MVTIRISGYRRTAVGAALATVAAQVRRAVGHRHRGAVDGADQQPTPTRRPRRRPGEQLEQRPQRFGSDPAASLGERRTARPGRRQRLQSGGQPCPHLLVAALGEQSGREQQVHHHPRGQIAHPFLHTRRRRERVVDHLERHDLGQLAEVTGREPAYGNLDGAADDRL